MGSVLGLNRVVGGAQPVIDIERQTNGGAEFVPPGDGNARQYLLRVIFQISSVAVRLNSIAMLSLPFGAAAGAVEAVMAWRSPHGGVVACPAQLFQYGMLLVNLFLFMSSLGVSILSAVALHGDPLVPTASATLIRWAEGRLVILLCFAVALLVLTYAVLGFWLISTAHIAATSLAVLVSDSHVM